MSLATQELRRMGEISFPSKGMSQRLATLRQAMGQGVTVGDSVPSGIDGVDAHLPGRGLLLGALHEVVPEDFRALPASWGFLLALAKTVTARRRGPFFWPLLKGDEHEFGIPYGAGLKRFGLDPGKFLFARCANASDVLWAMEEALRLGGAAAVLGRRTPRMTLTASRRLQLAAEKTGTPIFLLRAPADTMFSAARSLWRVAPAPSARDRFGLMTNPRWTIALIRARGGGIGEWMVEWDHDALCLRLPPVLADRTAHTGKTQKRA
jgi:protein ImuA